MLHSYIFIQIQRGDFPLKYAIHAVPLYSILFMFIQDKNRRLKKNRLQSTTLDYMCARLFSLCFAHKTQYTQACTEMCTEQKDVWEQNLDSLCPTFHSFSHFLFFLLSLYFLLFLSSTLSFVL